MILMYMTLMTTICNATYAIILMTMIYNVIYVYVIDVHDL